MKHDGVLRSDVTKIGAPLHTEIRLESLGVILSFREMLLYSLLLGKCAVTSIHPAAYQAIHSSLLIEMGSRLGILSLAACAPSNV